jgi:hypothetical protein
MARAAFEEDRPRTVAEFQAWHARRSDGSSSRAGRA